MFFMVIKLICAVVEIDDTKVRDARRAGRYTSNIPRFLPKFTCIISL
jgi:hypothetical protein